MLEKHDAHEHEHWDGSHAVVEQREALAASYVPGSEAEKKFLRKIDMRIVVSTGLTHTPLAPSTRLTSAMHLGPLHPLVPRPRQHR